MAEPVCWGILGASGFAAWIMAPAIKAARDAELVALGTSDPSKAEGFRPLAPRLRVHTSYDALLADPEVEAVYIPLPNHLHVAWTLRAVEAGKHVLCEKPMALHASEFDRLIAARDRSGLLVAEAFMIVHHPQWLRAREMLQEGAIGRLVHVDANFSFNTGGEPYNIRNRPETGGGSLRDIGVYTFGAARFVSGEEPGTVTPIHLRRENGVDVFALVAAQFPSFTFAGFTSLRMTMRQEVVLHGDKALLRVPSPFNPGYLGQAELVLETGSLREEVKVERFHHADPYVLEIENFGRSLREGVPFPCPLEFSRGTQRMVNMVFEAEGRSPDR